VRASGDQRSELSERDDADVPGAAERNGVTHHEGVAMKDWPEIRDAVAKLCERFPGEYWRGLGRERT